ncbi:unnamed protein product [Rangifer tarandus platyrhynchus]|uniref:Uncharacterized protein n=1 Tax=Rangifer tarandus platyrhynchus TaxID=3082113 RepID=A0ABN8XJE0_RANTA|nr:unnamed protein product [Rangifer tarandus platyrhynchus]
MAARFIIIELPGATLGALQTCGASSLQLCECTGAAQGAFRLRPLRSSSAKIQAAPPSTGKDEDTGRFAIKRGPSGGSGGHRGPE